jgi:hypothetical protein
MNDESHSTPNREDGHETARRDGHVAFSARFGVLPCKPGKSRLWLGRSLRRFEYGNGRAEIGGCSANATA